MEAEIQARVGSVTRTEINTCKAELSRFLRYQYSILEEKSKHKWMAEGDMNTSFFHGSIKARRVHNRMKLQMAHGTLTEEASVIGAKAVTYFKNLFGSFPSFRDIDVASLIKPKISPKKNNMLTRIPDEEEVKAAVYWMNHSSSLGPDGFTSKFFVSCWNIIKSDLLDAVKGFFVGLQLPKHMSSAHIILLPMVKNAMSFDKVRPISRCNFVHKILSRILNDRLKLVLPDLISEEQAGFVEGRNIHKTIGLAHDIVNDIENKSFGGNVVVKLDMSKAYDRLSWRFLLKMLRAFGFSEQWCDLIYRNIANYRYSICWDWETYGHHFKSNRGVRQGDPLSPSLFILAMEYFSQLLNQAVRFRKVIPYKTKGGKSMIHHLLYADDMLIFSNGHKNSIRHMLNLINDFCDASGQLLNQENSKVHFAESFIAERWKSILDLTSFSEGTLPRNYLGAPLFPRRARIRYFRYMEEVVKTKIASWIKNFSSMSDRATLIASVLCSMSIHTLSILPVPNMIIQRIERLMRNFLWDRSSSARHHWVNWDTIYRPKDEGGLNWH
ncbi:hypothetical protein QQ045_018270 [Rhodiola kirilowii]